MLTHLTLKNLILFVSMLEEAGLLLQLCRHWLMDGRAESIRPHSQPARAELDFLVVLEDNDRDSSDSKADKPSLSVTPSALKNAVNSSF